ncbi:MAG: tetratricopeptide (TPR) repeat protein [Chlamydiales bacterium]
MTSNAARRRAVGLLLVVVTLAVYARTLRFDFVGFDDPNYVTENQQVQAGLTGESIAWAWSTGHAENWHPVTWMSHMLDHELFGLDAMGPHAVNAALHALNVLLLYVALLWMTGALGASTWIAAIFALHPLHVESVAWISERKDLLSTFFGLLSLLSYVSYAKRPRSAPYVLTLLMLSLSLMSKPMLVTLPFVFLLLDRWPLRRTEQVSGARLLVEKLPLLLIVLVMSAVVMRVQAVTETDLAGLAMGPRIANALSAYATYLQHALWPTQLGVFYPHPYFPGGSPLSTLRIAVSATVVLGISVGVMRARRPYATVGWLWFLGMLVPTIGLVQVGAQASADRYMYVPLIGLCVAVAFACKEWSETRGTPSTGRTLSALATLSVVACGWLTWGQLGHWKDSETLYTQALRVEPGAAVMHSNLAVHYMNTGNIAPAREHFERALEINPRLTWTLGSYGMLLRSQGEFAKAEPLLRRAIAENPDYMTARVNLGWALAAQGKLGAARKELQNALTAEPENALAHRVMGMTLEGAGDPDRARRSYERSLTLEANPATHMLIAQLHLRQGDADTALKHFTAALQLGHDPVPTETRIGELLLAGGQPAEAIACFERALAQDPRYGPALKALEQARLALTRR